MAGESAAASAARTEGKLAVLKVAATDAVKAVQKDATKAAWKAARIASS
jgi:hypothetical protein